MLPCAHRWILRSERPTEPNRGPRPAAWRAPRPTARPPARGSDCPESRFRRHPGRWRIGRCQRRAGLVIAGGRGMARRPQHPVEFQNARGARRAARGDEPAEASRPRVGDVGGQVGGTVHSGGACRAASGERRGPSRREAQLQAQVDELARVLGEAHVAQAIVKLRHAERVLRLDDALPACWAPPCFRVSSAAPARRPLRPRRDSLADCPFCLGPVARRRTGAAAATRSARRCGRGRCRPPPCRSPCGASP